MGEPFTLTAVQLLSGYRDGSLSPVDALQSVLARTAARNPDINALFHIAEDAALAQAEASAARWRAGSPIGVLDGVPVTVKDSIAVAGMPMLRGLKANAGKPPSSYDAPPTARLREAGAVIFGKTTMPDFGLLASGVSTAFGITRNPWNLDCNSGGSSAGAAAAVAARCGPLAVGSDIGGSVRIPAALCGLVGLKPTQGRIPHLPPSPVRSAGPLARTAQDAALLLTVLAGADPRDYGALPPDPTRYHEALDRDVRGVRIALCLEGDNGRLPEPAVGAAVEASAARLAAAGAIVTTVPSVVGSELMEAVGLLLMMRGLTEYLNLPESQRGSTPGHFAAWFERGEKTSAVDVGRAQDRIEAIKTRVLAQLAEFDYLISPVTAFSGFPAGDRQVPSEAGGSTLYTPVWNQTGNPAASVPIGLDPDRGVPIGLQIVGHRFDDLGVLQMAAALERIGGFVPHWPA